MLSPFSHPIAALNTLSSLPIFFHLPAAFDKWVTHSFWKTFLVQPGGYSAPGLSSFLAMTEPAGSLSTVQMLVSPGSIFLGHTLFLVDPMIPGL
jgi:hypothetical protein